jgi:hypothetical protein
MSEKNDSPEGAYLDRVNAQISSGLRRCHSIVDDYRKKLAANSNEPDAANEDDDEERDLDEA